MIPCIFFFFPDKYLLPFTLSSLGHEDFLTFSLSPRSGWAFGLQVRGNAMSPSLRAGLGAHTLGWKSSTVRPHLSTHPPTPLPSLVHRSILISLPALERGLSVTLF